MRSRPDSRFILASMLAMVVLAGCGGGNANTNTGSEPVTAPAEPMAAPTPVMIAQDDGTMVAQADPVMLSAMMKTSAPGMTETTGKPPLCKVSLYSINYATLGGRNEKTDASAAIMVPSGTDTICNGARPVLLYAHGTTVEKSYNMANLRGNAEAALVAAMFAAQGYIVVAPNYAGYDTSTLSYHPFLNAQQQSTDMMDALRRARSGFAAIGARDSGKLFLAGYSQGGHVAMATQRAMQQDAVRARRLNQTPEFIVTALAGMSGPYAMAMLGDTIFNGSPNLGGTVFLPMTATSWQKSYGGLYAAPVDVYEDAYASGIESLIPSTLYTYSGLFNAGKLPEYAVFATNSLPAPSPAFVPYFGDGNLVKSSFRDTYQADAEKHPCDLNAAYPLECAPENGFRKAAVRNDLRTYVPTVPVMMCGGNEDPTVFFSSTQATALYFRLHHMVLTDLTVLDVDALPIEPYAAIKKGFSLAKTATMTAATLAGKDPATAVTNAYHGYLVPPFCNAAALRFFAAAASP